MIDALWGAGYYNVTVTISLGAASLTIASSEVSAFASAAESHRNRAVAPVAIKVDPGPLFRLRSIRVVNAVGVEFSPDELPPRIVGLKPGDPAVASDLRAAQARIIDWFRNQGRPLAKVQSIAPRRSRGACHGRDGDGGPRPGRAVRRSDDEGTGQFRSGNRALVPLYPAGRSLFAARGAGREDQHPPDSAVGGVRITEGTALDAYGRLPNQIDVEDRLPYAVGASARVKSTASTASIACLQARNCGATTPYMRLNAAVQRALRPSAGITKNSKAAS